MELIHVLSCTVFFNLESFELSVRFRFPGLDQPDPGTSTRRAHAYCKSNTLMSVIVSAQARAQAPAAPARVQARVVESLDHYPKPSANAHAGPGSSAPSARPLQLPKIGAAAEPHHRQPLS